MSGNTMLIKSSTLMAEVIWILVWQPQSRGGAGTALPTLLHSFLRCSDGVAELFKPYVVKFLWNVTFVLFSLFVFFFFFFVPLPLPLPGQWSFSSNLTVWRREAFLGEETALPCWSSEPGKELHWLSHLGTFSLSSPRSPNLDVHEEWPSWDVLL